MPFLAKQPLFGRAIRHPAMAKEKRGLAKKL
jgi:hypothetical protein